MGTASSEALAFTVALAVKGGGRPDDVAFSPLRCSVADDDSVSRVARDDSSPQVIRARLAGAGKGPPDLQSGCGEDGRGREGVGVAGHAPVPLPEHTVRVGRRGPRLVYGWEGEVHAGEAESISSWGNVQSAAARAGVDESATAEGSGIATRCGHN